MEKPNCYECKWRENLSGDAHSCCQHPNDEKCNVKANATGIKRGWFRWPWNFDPAWLVSCDGFEGKDKEHNGQG